MLPLSLQAKLNLQQHWIQDLTEQNEMLVSIVEELEQEATERIRLLEDKLKKTATAEREVITFSRTQLVIIRPALFVNSSFPFVAILFRVLCEKVFLPVPSSFECR